MKKIFYILQYWFDSVLVVGALANVDTVFTVHDNDWLEYVAETTNRL